MLMAAADSTGSDPAPASSRAPGPGSGSAEPGPAAPAEASPELSLSELLSVLSGDRQWLLRQLDGGAWPQWRLDLAALERELGELLERLADGSARPG